MFDLPNDDLEKIIVDENSASLDAASIQVFKSSKKEKTAN